MKTPRTFVVTSERVPTEEEAVAMLTTPKALDLILEAVEWYARRHRGETARAAGQQETERHRERADGLSAGSGH